MQFKVKDQIRLLPELCKQLEVRKLYGTITTIFPDDPPNEIKWEDETATNISRFYESEIAKRK